MRKNKLWGGGSVVVLLLIIFLSSSLSVLIHRGSLGEKQGVWLLGELTGGWACTVPVS